MSHRHLSDDQLIDACFGVPESETHQHLVDCAACKARRDAVGHMLTEVADAATTQADAIFTPDVGLPIVWAARYLTMNGKRRLIGSYWHGSMANAMPQAIGAQAASPGRQVISLSGDGGFTMLMGDLLSLTQLKLPVKVFVFINWLLGFVALEQKSTGFLPIGIDLVNPNFAQTAEAIESRESASRTLRTLTRASRWRINSSFGIPRDFAIPSIAIGVFIKPGIITFARMLYLAFSFAIC